MNRSEAEKLVGTKVKGWTATKGEYVGELVEVIPSRPWRGKVKITGFLRCVTPWVNGAIPKVEYLRQIGDVVEMGNSSIKPATEDEVSREGVSHLDCLQEEKSRIEGWQENPNQKDVYWMGQTVKAIDILSGSLETC